MISSKNDPLLSEITRKQVMRQWHDDAMRLRAMGYASIREARLREGTLRVQKALERAAAGHPEEAWGQTYSGELAIPADPSSTTHASHAVWVVPFGMKLGLACILSLLFLWAWYRERLRSSGGTASPCP